MRCGIKYENQIGRPAIPVDNTSYQHRSVDNSSSAPNFNSIALYFMTKKILNKRYKESDALQSNPRYLITNSYFLDAKFVNCKRYIYICII